MEQSVEVLSTKKQDINDSACITLNRTLPCTYIVVAALDYDLLFGTVRVSRTFRRLDSTLDGT
eukprot:4579532-Pleurochrysis_carterae.AAC.1